MPKLLKASAAACLFLFAWGSAAADYPEEDIEIIIPFSAGGGFDTYVRALLPYLEQQLPEDINVLPINLPGAGGQRGASDVYRAEPDGYTIGIFNMPGILLPELQGMRTGYDLSKITWIVTIGSDPYAYIVKGDSPLNSIDDVKALGRPAVFGATGPSSTSYAATNIVNHSLNIPYRIVTGYRGSTDYILGVIRGDVDAALAPLSNARAYIDSGDLKMLALIGAKSADPAVPDADCLGIPELAKINVVRMIGGPPGMSPGIRTTLEKALLAALADPGFKNWLVQTGNSIQPAGSAETAKAVSDMTEFYRKFKDVL